MNINDKIYAITEVNHLFTRKKFTMTDELGNTWHRYDKHNITFKLDTHTIVGKISTTIEGTAPEEQSFEDYYYTDLGYIVYESEIDCSVYQHWFSDKNIAQKVLEEKRQQQRV